jgi:hypothetical protein
MAYMFTIIILHVILLLMCTLVKSGETSTTLAEISEWKTYEQLLKDPHVTLIQYYSKTNKDCKNCEIFQAQWKELQIELFKDVKFAQVDVDTEEGADTALRTGALTGIPHVRLQYHGTDYYSLMDEHITPNDQIIAMVKRELDGHERGDNGMYLKKFESGDL